MAERAVAMQVRLMMAASVPGSNVSALCREHGVSRQSYYKWRDRFAAGGLPGLEPLAPVPRSRPGMTAGWVEDEIVAVRKRLAEDGTDHGPDPIRWALLAAAAGPDGVVPAELVPSRATIARVLARRGMIVPAPQKRPRASLLRFVYQRPNDCWQSDWTHHRIAGGVPVAIAGTLDDHSRKLVGIGAEVGTDATAALVWQVIADAIDDSGVPVRSLTDNGMVYSMRRRGGVAAFEANLHKQGTITICSSPFHPQTCGKIERFWQTLKKWLAARDPASSLEELLDLLAAFQTFYNQQRPHRALRGATPASVWAATERSAPIVAPLPAGPRLDQAMVTAKGELNLDGRVIGIGKAYIGQRLDIHIDGHHLLVFAGTRLIRELDIDPARRGQPRNPTAATPATMTTTEQDPNCQR